MKKTAMITGASRGIGEAIARELASKDYNLCLCCSKSVKELEQISQELTESFNIEILTFVGDVGDYSFVSNMVNKTLEKFKQIDVLINNAGISYVGLLTDMTIEQWNTIISTNLTSVFSTCNLVVPQMVSRKEGKIINISSVWGNVGASCEVAYSATKGGINSFTKALGKELAPSNIQVNAIACGCVDTSMNSCFTEEDKLALAEEIPAGRFAHPTDVAQLVSSLITANDYLTSQVITLDGGWI